MTSDKLIIDTPEQVHLEFVVAGIGSRFMAVFLDSIIEFAVVLLLAFAASVGGLLNSWGSIWWRAIVGFVVFCIQWGYHAGFEALWKGQTPGKRWAGIRVIKDSGRPINAFEAILRNLVRVVDFFPGFYGAGIVAMLLNSKNRRLGDYVAGTLVVHESAEREATLFFNTAAQPEVPLHQAAGLTIQEAELIETFLARRLEIPPAVRQLNGQRIAEMVASRLGIDAASRPADTEAFLELLVREFRSRGRYR